MSLPANKQELGGEEFQLVMYEALGLAVERLRHCHRCMFCKYLVLSHCLFSLVRLEFLTSSFKN